MIDVGVRKRLLMTRQVMARRGVSVEFRIRTVKEGYILGSRKVSEASIEGRFRCSIDSNNSVFFGMS